MGKRNLLSIGLTTAVLQDHNNNNYYGKVHVYIGRGTVTYGTHTWLIANSAQYRRTTKAYKLYLIGINIAHTFEALI